MFDLETGKRLTLAELFYEDVKYIVLINNRLRASVDEENAGLRHVRRRLISRGGAAYAAKRGKSTSSGANRQAVG